MGRTEMLLWILRCINCLNKSLFSLKLSLMTKNFSFTALTNWFYRYAFMKAGMRSAMTDLGDGTIVQCWVPKTHKEDKPTLLLIHGFGSNAMWQWKDLLRRFNSEFNIYIPDLIFFGDSFSTRPERTESFQAQCLMKVMEAHGLRKFNLAGISYGGFVAYSMAAQFPDVVERLVLCCAGVCLEEKDLKEGLFVVSSVDEAASILLPQTPEKLRQLVRFSFAKPAKTMPTWFLRDFIDVMCAEYVQEKRQLIQALIKDRRISNLPKITQQTLIAWGEKDQIFPLELGHRLKRFHLGENAEMVVINNAGHALNIEKPKELYNLLKSFLLIDSLSPPQLSGNKED